MITVITLVVLMTQLQSAMASTLSVSSIQIKVGMICDMECSAWFRNNNTVIRTFLVNEVLTLNTNFETLKLMKISFKLTSVSIIKSKNDQTFVENARLKNNTLTITAIIDNFGKWAYGKDIQQDSDVLILFTGSNASHHSSVYPFSICRNNTKAKITHSVIVFKISHAGYSTTSLSWSMGRLLGANRDNACDNQAKLMSNKDCRSASSVYFSNLADEQIQKLLSTKTFPCFGPAHFTKELRLEFSRYKLPTFDDQCVLQYPSHAKVKAYVSRDMHRSCSAITCKNGNDTLGTRIPLHNTPCASKMVCFRQRCIPAGSILVNLGSGYCLLASSHINRKKVYFERCPEYAHRFDRVEIRMYNNSSFLIVATNNEFEHQEKCLTVDTDQQTVEFDHCPSATYTSFLWESIPINDNKLAFSLCHLQLKKCLEFDESGSEHSWLKCLPISEKKGMIWTLHDPEEQLNISKPKKNLAAEEQEVLMSTFLQIRLALVCDNACFALFEYQEANVTRYWANVLRDAQAKLQTVKNLTVKFYVTSWTIMKEVSPQEALNKNNLRDFDIAVQTTAGSLNELVTVQPQTLASSATGVLGTIFLTPDSSSTSGQCEDLADAMIHLFLHAIPEKVYAASKYIEYMRHGKEDCKTSRYYVSPCYEFFLLHFALHKNSSLDVIETKIDIHDESIKSFTLEDQCNIGTHKGASVRQEEKPCEAATCLFPSPLSTPFERVIYPLYKATCGQFKYCFRGHCISKGHQIQHVETGMCLMGINKNSEEDVVDLFQCEDDISPFHAFSVRRYSDEGAFLVSPYTTTPSSEIAEKCLTYDSSANVVKHEKCPKNLSAAANFLWRLNFTDDTNTTLTIRLDINESCMELTHNEGHARLNKCDNDTSTYWKFVPMLHKEEHQTVLPEDIPDSEGILIVYYLLIATGCAGVVTFLVIGLVCGYKFGKNKRLQTLEIDYNALFGVTSAENTGSVHTSGIDNAANQTDMLPYDNKWEIPYNDIQFGNLLGSGAFGCVFEAEVHGSKAAVKTALPSHDLAPVKALASELKLMANVGTHLNIIRLIGACTDSLATMRKLCVVLEYCENGNLLEYLHNNASRFLNKNFESKASCFPYGSNPTLESFTSVNLLFWAYQVARGMSFLSSRRILHGDLAARNILLAKDLVVKISDFGFSKHLNKTYNYNYKKALKDGLFPYKWMAPESILKGVFSCQSDCWSYGILFWEIFTLGNKPYPGMQVNEAFVDRISNGYRMPIPENCPESVYEMMLQCWNENPEERPLFSDIAESLDAMLGSTFASYYTQLEVDFSILCQKQIERTTISSTATYTFESFVESGKSFPNQVQ